jgi:AcrR family transcriptional regulator
MADQRNFILDTALECLIEKGLHTTSLADICRSSKLSVGAVYVHFRNKEEILLGVAERNLLQLHEHPSIATWEDFEEWMLRSMSYYSEHGGVRRARLAAQLLAESHENSVLMDMQQRYLRAQEELLGKSLRDLENEGEVSLPLGTDQSVSIILQLLLGAYLGSIREPEVSWEERGKRLVEALRTLVKA